MYVSFGSTKAEREDRTRSDRKVVVALSVGLTVTM